MHYVASINIFEKEGGEARVSVKVFRVFDFGARPRTPIWKEVVTIHTPTAQRPKEWLRAALEELTRE